jgi:ABC-2 type transport system ATP-binding protein
MTISLNQLQFSFRNKRIFDNVTLTVPEGAIYGLLGRNGVGKSTLIKLMLGVLSPHGGEIVFDNQILTRANRIEYLRSVGSLIENTSAYNFLSAFQNLELARRIYGTDRGYSNQLLDLVGLSNSKQKVGEFSLGMRQRLGIALSLIGNPKVVFLDEPTNGLDPEGIITFYNLVKMINKEQSVTFFISSHHLAEMDDLVTHVSILHDGVALYNTVIDKTKTPLSELFFESTNSLEKWNR